MTLIFPKMLTMGKLGIFYRFEYVSKLGKTGANLETQI